MLFGTISVEKLMICLVSTELFQTDFDALVALTEGKHTEIVCVVLLGDKLFRSEFFAMYFSISKFEIKPFESRRLTSPTGTALEAILPFS